MDIQAVCGILCGLFWLWQASSALITFSTVQPAKKKSEPDGCSFVLAVVITTVCIAIFYYAGTWDALISALEARE